ncbi:MAG: hypothetical protein IPJ30_24365 [Acidobacteria bacterium]|nr:hypothetical protein [Acidobacteriota bacterium]MBK8150678.1 hypothetical protein [Acidobacteriota bacterium]
MAHPSAFESVAWKRYFGFDLFGTRIGVRTDDPRLASADDLLPGDLQTVPYEACERFVSIVAGGGRVPNGLYLDSRDFEPAFNFDELDGDSLKGLETKLQFAIALLAAPKLFLIHAGAVSIGGRGILIPGNTFSGKTTLVRTLIEAGGEYYTDDCAILDGDGNLYPYPIPLAVRDGERRESRSARSLGGADGTIPVRVKLVLFPAFREGGVWNPVRMATGVAGFRLLDSFFYNGVVREFPAETMRFVARLCSEADVFEGERGEASEVLSWVEGILKKS